MTEFNLFQDIELVEDGIYETYHDRYDITWLSSTPFNLESYTAIQQGIDAYGDNHDCLYTLTNDFLLGENDLALAYGVDHTRTGQAVYNNVVIYGRKYLNGLGGLTNDRMEKSARQFVADTLIADNLYAYGFSRHPVPGNPYVFVVPSDTFKTLSGINPGDEAFLCTRLYVNSVTKIGPDPLEVVLDRFVLLRPKSTGIFEAEILDPLLKVFPNPVKDKARIEVSVPGWSEIEMSLFSPAGQQIGKTVRFDHVRGKVWQDIDFGNGLPGGIYLLKAVLHEKGSGSRQVMTSKVIYQR